MRYLGIDYGSKKVGLAVSDEAGTMGFPYAIVPNNGHLVDELLNIIKKEGIGEIVVGESLNSNGGDNPIMKGARALASKIEERSGLPVHFELEAFTTQEASRDFEGERMTGRLLVDSAAAAIILTSYLSRTKA